MGEGAEVDEDAAAAGMEESSNDGEDSRDSSISSATSAANAAAVERKFLCPHPGCTKKYKNMNGVRHHQRTAHAQPGAPPPRMHRCTHCTKEYKTSQVSPT